jgi:acetyl-CoA acetyltransferase
MGPIGIVGYHRLPPVEAYTAGDEAEMVHTVVSAALEEAGMERSEVGFFCSGSADYVMGRPFSFVGALDGAGVWPPRAESHVEMDGAWALYEAWVRLHHGDIDVAVVYAFGKASLGDLSAIHTLQLDPYSLAPMGIGPHAMAALQARAVIEAGLASEADFAAVVSRSRAAFGLESPSPEALLAAPQTWAPLRDSDLPRWTDGAAAVVLATPAAIKTTPAWIAGIDHRVDVHQPGLRDLTQAPGVRISALRLGVGDKPIEVAELHAQWSHEEGILCRALGLGPEVTLNPSGGAIVAATPMVAGLERIGEAARAIRSGEAVRALAHATQGPCLQQNLVCVLEAQHGG